MPSSGTLWGVYRLFSMNATEVARAVRQLPDGTHEFMFHPRDGPNDADVQALLTLCDSPELAQVRLASANIPA